MKAFAIFLVVMDHLISISDGIDNPVRTFIYSLHLPLFFFVSGYLAEKKLNSLNEIVTFIRKKLKLLIPIAVFGGGNCLILNESITELLIWHKFGLWFFWTLFLLFVIYSLTNIVLINNENKYLEVLGLTIPILFCVMARKYEDTQVGGIFNFLNLYNYAFLIMGVIISRYNLKRLIFSDRLQILLILIYLIGLSTGLPALNIPMKACGVLVTWRVMSRLVDTITDNNVNQVFLYVGKNSLYIYILHFYIFRGLTQLPTEIHDIIFSNVAFYIPIYSLVAVAIIAISLAISYVINTNKILTFICFGR